MNIPRTQIDALQALGYTEDEARFLYLVATHSGYFVARQFLGFTGAYWGKRTTLFWNKLQADRHARTYRSLRAAPLTICSRGRFTAQSAGRISAIAASTNSNTSVPALRCSTSCSEISISHYLETEPDKVAYFCTKLQLPKQHLPSKTYSGRHTVTPTVRYFVDRYPMFFPAPSSGSQIVTLTYIQDAEANLAGFVHHLQMYLPLFRELSEFRFLFLARTMRIRQGLGTVPRSGHDSARIEPRRGPPALLRDSQRLGTRPLHFSD